MKKKVVLVMVVALLATGLTGCMGTKPTKSAEQMQPIKIPNSVTVTVSGDHARSYTKKLVAEKIGERFMRLSKYPYKNELHCSAIVNFKCVHNGDREKEGATYSAKADGSLNLYYVDYLYFINRGKNNSHRAWEISFKVEDAGMQGDKHIFHLVPVSKTLERSEGMMSSMFKATILDDKANLQQDLEKTVPRLAFEIKS